MYKEELKDERWLAKRDKILARDKICQNCGSSSRKEVHHLAYIKGKKAWQYPERYLIVLCRKCHQEEHKNMQRIIDYITQMRLSGLLSHEIIKLLIK